jgi:hypothetical protein
VPAIMQFNGRACIFRVWSQSLLFFIVGTNYFGHFYLNQRVLPLIKADGGRIIVTASGVHDPESPGGGQGVPAGLGELRGLEMEGKKCEMIDGSPFNADKAYKDSKVRTGRFMPSDKYLPGARLTNFQSVNFATCSCAAFCSRVNSSVGLMLMLQQKVSRSTVSCLA